LHCLIASGQKAPFNCLLLKNIITKIDSEKQNIELSGLIYGKCYVVSNPKKFGDYSIKKRKDYVRDIKLDSILKLPNIDAILGAVNDSVFYLTNDNVIVDTFCFFTPGCSCRVNGKNIIVVNNYRLIPTDKSYNILTVYSLDDYGFYSFDKEAVHIPKLPRFINSPCISLRHKSSKNEFDKVMFPYFIKNNQPIIKEAKVTHKNQF